MGYADAYICEADTVIVGRKGSINNPIFVEEPFWNVDTAFGLQAKREVLLPRYLFYFCKFFDFERLNKAVTIPSLTKGDLLKIEIDLPELSKQQEIVNQLMKIEHIIELRKHELSELDNLIKARFVEMFGDPITNSKELPREKMDKRYFLKAGITTSADDIHEYIEGKYEIPCYGGNGVRGYVEEFSYEGEYPIIGRQGALCGNVQYASEKFHATEHAVLVSMLKDDNTIWAYYMLSLMDLYRYHTGAAQPGLAVKTLNTVDVIVVEKKLQNQFAAFVAQVDKSKVAVQKSLEEVQLLFNSLMQEYFG
jgi:type I restriction enzyme S subunit